MEISTNGEVAYTLPFEVWYRRISGSSKEANNQHQPRIAVGPRENKILGKQTFFD